MRVKIDMDGVIYRGNQVLSGGARREDLVRYAYRPDKIVESIADLHHANLSRDFSQSKSNDNGAPAEFVEDLRANAAAGDSLATH